MFLGLYDSFASALCEYRLNQTKHLNRFGSNRKSIPFCQVAFFAIAGVFRPASWARVMQETALLSFRVKACDSEAEGPQTNLSHRSR
jgi:hypothetical protein